MEDPAQVGDKRRSRQGQITKLTKGIESLTHLLLKEVKLFKVERKLEEAKCNVYLYEALQTRCEELLEKNEEQYLVTEKTNGEQVRIEHDHVLHLYGLLYNKVESQHVSQWKKHSNSLVNLLETEKVPQLIVISDKQRLEPEAQD